MQCGSMQRVMQLYRVCAAGLPSAGSQLGAVTSRTDDMEQHPCNDHGQPATVEPSASRAMAV